MIDRSKVWTQTLNAAALGDGDGSLVRLYDTTLRDGEQTVGLVLEPRAEARDRPAGRRSRRRPHRGRVPACLRRRPPRDRDDRRRGSAGGAVGIRPCGSGRRRRDPRARPARVGDRGAGVGSEAECARRLAREDRRAHQERRRPRRRLRREGRVLRRRRVACGPRLPRRRLPRGARRGCGGGGRRRHARDRGAGGGHLLRRQDPRRDRAATCRSTTTATTTSAWRPPVRSPRSGPAPTGSTPPSTGWASGRATRTCPRSRSRSRRCTATARTCGSRRPSASRRASARSAGTQLAPWSPLVGENLFRRETGAVAAQFHDPPAVEPYSSALVGATRAIVLGKKSGADSIRIKADELGLELPEERRRAVLEAVKARAIEKGGLVDDDEFRELAAPSEVAAG